VSLVFTDKWLPCVPYLRIFCITYLFWPLHTANLNAIKAMGRSDLFLKLEIAKNIIGFILLIATMNISVMAMAYSLLVNSVASQIINSWPNRKLLNYRYSEQLADILPSIALSVAMGFVVYPISWLPIPTFVILVLQFFIGAAFYLAVSSILKFDSYDYMKQMTVSFIKKMRGRA
jgi:O-antigen/teichoic acid export membrane protein